MSMEHTGVLQHLKELADETGAAVVGRKAVRLAI
jgi:hypothetical protein